MYPKDVQSTDQGCLVVRSNDAQAATGMPVAYLHGLAPASPTARTVWDCAFWGGGVVFVGRMISEAAPDFFQLAIHVAGQPHRWTALPSKPTA